LRHVEREPVASFVGGERCHSPFVRVLDCS
jgi:hypothetical protein